MSYTVSKEPAVNNVKIGFRYDYKKHTPLLFKKKLDNIKGELKHYHNFSKWRNKFTYLIYWTKGYVNTTGIKNLVDIDESKHHFMKLLDITEEDITSQPSIHNICASGSYSKVINIPKIEKHLREFEKTYRVTYHRSYFPAIFVKIPNIGTCNLFRNGNFSIVGVRQMENIPILMDLITSALNNV